MNHVSHPQKRIYDLHDAILKIILISNFSEKFPRHIADSSDVSTLEEDAIKYYQDRWETAKTFPFNPDFERMCFIARVNQEAAAILQVVEEYYGR